MFAIKAPSQIFERVLYIQATKNIGIFEVKLRFRKSQRLLQRVAFFIFNLQNVFIINFQQTVKSIFAVVMYQSQRAFGHFINQIICSFRTEHLDERATSKWLLTNELRISLSYYGVISTCNRMALSAINDKFDERKLRKFSSLSYCESNLSLIARETIRLLVNHQPIPIAIQSKIICLEQICYERSEGIVVTSLHCLLFPTSKNKDLKRISKSATNVV